MGSKRASGILLHITSLPSKYGIGDLGPEAYRFADFLVAAGQTYWQILPINMPAAEIHHCPYHVLSAFAGNAFLISPDLLYRQGLLAKSDIRNLPSLPGAQVDLRKVVPFKRQLLNRAYQHFKNNIKDSDFERFCRENKKWLNDYALFAAMREHFGLRCWADWPPRFRDRKKDTLESIGSQLQEAVEKQKFLQYQFLKQWLDLKRYCNQKGIRIIGDIPIYIAHDSADVWTNPKIFKLTKKKKPSAVSGTPPDRFAKTGQLWGHPVYDWDALKHSGYRWWFARIEHNLELFDIIRIDHFLAFESFWQVPAGHTTTAKGKWVSAPGRHFFKTLFKNFPDCPLIVEDLGHITPEVTKLIEKFNLPGMRILQYAFDDNPKENTHWLHNHIRNCVVYTGTHDNNTVRGWFDKNAKPKQKQQLFDYLGRRVSPAKLHWELVRLAFSSVADTAIIPMQDILGLSEKARMNRPGTIRNNWRWRLGRYQLSPSLTEKLAKLTTLHGRA